MTDKKRSKEVKGVRPVKDNELGYITVAQLAEKEGVTTIRIYQLIAEGKRKAIRIGRTVLVSPEKFVE